VCNLCILKTIYFILPTYTYTHTHTHTHLHGHHFICMHFSFSPCVRFYFVILFYFFLTYNFYFLSIGHCCHGASELLRWHKIFLLFHVGWPEMPASLSNATPTPPNLMRNGFGLESGIAVATKLDKSNKFSCSTVRRALLLLYDVQWERTVSSR